VNGLPRISSFGVVGEFEGPDVTALSADFPLEISDDGAQVLEGVTGACGESVLEGRNW
jgi:hypothetical protein